MNSFSGKLDERECNRGEKKNNEIVAARRFSLFYLDAESFIHLFASYYSSSTFITLRC